MGVAAGIGVLARVEACRRLALGLCVFISATIFWKHPYQAVLASVQTSPEAAEIVALAAELGDPERTLPFVIRVFIACASAMNLAVCGTVAWLLTRPSVKARFSR